MQAEAALQSGSTPPELMLHMRRQTAGFASESSRHTGTTGLSLPRRLHSLSSTGARQLAAHAVGRLDGAVVEEVVVAPLGGLPVLLIRMVHVEQREVVPCSAEQGMSMCSSLHRPQLPTHKPALQHANPVSWHKDW